MAAPEEATSAERVARNDAIFREANEQIRESADVLGVEFLPTVCECAEPSCRTLIRMTREEYEHVRARGERFVNAPGHQVAGQGWAQVVERHERYFVVEKIGRAGEIAKQLDPRASGRRDAEHAG